MKKLFYVVLAALCLYACNREEIVSGLHNESNFIEEGIKLYAQKSPEVETRAVAPKGKLWENGQTIRIKFLNGTATQHTKVEAFAQEWLEHANLHFLFVQPNENADIKIAFNWQGDPVTWSMVGTDAIYAPQSEPSLNFGNLSKLDKFMRRDVLMQFGHVLGLLTP